MSEKVIAREAIASKIMKWEMLTKKYMVNFPHSKRRKSGRGEFLPVAIRHNPTSSTYKEVNLLATVSNKR